MEGKVDDAGAFCASLADRVEGKGWRSDRSADLAKTAEDYQKHLVEVTPHPLAEEAKQYKRHLAPKEGTQ